MVYDVIIVGAGSMGMAAGYYLAKAGKKVLMLDTYTPLIRKVAIMGTHELSVMLMGKALVMCLLSKELGSFGRSSKR